MQIKSSSELDKLRGALTEAERALARHASELAVAVTPVWRSSRKRAATVGVEVSTVLQRLVTLLAEQSVRAATAELRGPPDARFVQQVNRVREEVARWSAVQALVAAQLSGTRRPLYRDGGRLEPIVARQIELADLVYREVHDLLRSVEQDHAAGAQGFPDIPLPISAFMQHAHAASRVARAQKKAAAAFLDVGCGIGLKVMAARKLFATGAGIEIDPGYAALARRILGAGAEIIEADASTFDGYDRFDVIYLFRPLRDDGALAALEAHIVGTAAPGTIIIAPYRGFRTRHDAHGAVRVARDVYLARTDPSFAAEMLRRAELVGPDTIRGGGTAPTLWEPVLAASFANGFALPREAWVDAV